MRNIHIPFAALLLLTLSFTSCTNKQTEVSDNTAQKIDTIKQPQMGHDTPPYTTDSITFQYGSLQQGSLTTVIEDTYLMTDSLLKNKSDVLIHVGDSVFIDTTATHFNSKGWPEDVYKVILYKYRTRTKGFLAMDKVAAAKKKLSDGNTFLFAYVRMDKNANGDSVLFGRAMVTDAAFKTLASKDFEVIGGVVNQDGTPGYYNTLEVTVKPPMGLKSIVNVVDLYMYYDACGYVNGHIILLWDGKQLQYGLQTNESIEASSYSQSEYPIYPAQPNGITDKILDVGVYIEYNDDGDKEIRHDSIVVQYGWTPEKGLALEDTIFTNKNKPKKKR